MDPKIAKSRAQEKRGAALHSGSQNVGSGNTPWRKNDVRGHDGASLIEYKRTSGKSITIKLADLEDVRKNALLEGRDALFGIEIGGRDYLLVEASDYEQQLRLISEHQYCGSKSVGDSATQLGDGEVPYPEGQPVLSRNGAGEQETAAGGQERLQGTRRIRRVPAAGGLS